MTKTALAVLRATAGDSLAAAVDVDGNTQLHHMAAEGGSYDLCLGLARLGINPNVLNKENDTALHIAARAGHMEVLRALVDAGADPLRRNGKNRLPGSQLKLSAEVKEFLEAAEERAKEAKEAKRSELWDGKMRAAQTESACIVRGL